MIEDLEGFPAVEVVEEFGREGFKAPLGSFVKPQQSRAYNGVMIFQMGYDISHI